MRRKRVVPWDATDQILYDSEFACGIKLGDIDPTGTDCPAFALF